MPYTIPPSHNSKSHAYMQKTNNYELSSGKRTYHNIFWTHPPSFRPTPSNTMHFQQIYTSLQQTSQTYQSYNGLYEEINALLTPQECPCPPQKELSTMASAAFNNANVRRTIRPMFPVWAGEAIPSAYSQYPTV